ncbi:terpene synthase family protein [Echinicola salinicaeni]|uniref:terpene synthase family protein n=1 Tax=Echinicola salinicaeni TaxID=2762757 RepID=UPI001645268A|nr:hypothetical protein [Echinicola salinicaeni]
MKKVGYLRRLKSLLDNYQWISWERYLLLQDFISFYSYRKKEVIRSERRKEMYLLVVMKGMAGMSLHGKLKKVFPSVSLVLDKSSYHLDKISPYAIEAMENSLIASIPVADMKIILQDMPDFKVLYRKLYVEFEQKDEFWNNLEGMPYVKVLSLIRSSSGGIEARLTKSRFAELVGVSSKTISRFDEMSGNKEERVHQPILNISGFQIMKHSNMEEIRQTMDGWGSFFPVLADPVSSRAVEKMNLAFLVSHLFPKGNKRKVHWAAKLIMLLSSIDIYMYHISSGDGKLYWERIRAGLQQAILQEDYQSPVPRLMAYYSAMQDLAEEARRIMEKDVWDEMKNLIKGYLEERGWKARGKAYDNEEDLAYYKMLRQAFSEGLLCMRLLKWIQAEYWQELKPYRDALENYMLQGVKLVALSNEILVIETNVYGNLPHNLVNLMNRINQTNKQDALATLWKEYQDVLDSMKMIKADILKVVEPKDGEKLKSFLMMVEAQVVGWPEWYGKVLVSHRNRNSMTMGEDK